MEGQTETGRAAVRALLLARLDQAGLVRPKGVSAEAHAAMRARLVDALDHMTPANLVTLAELVIENGAGPQRACWPSEAVVRSWAQALQPRPLAQHRIVTSWLASVKGPVAEAGGWLVELYRFLDRHHRPPGSYDEKLLRDQAAENNRQRGLIRSRIERGAASQADLVWSEAYAEDQRRAQAAVDSGRGRRSEALDSDTKGAAA